MGDIKTGDDPVTPADDPNQGWQGDKALYPAWNDHRHGLLTKQRAQSSIGTTVGRPVKGCVTSVDLDERGCFAIPTVFADASDDWRPAREETFGPALVAIPWKERRDGA